MPPPKHDKSIADTIEEEGRIERMLKQNQLGTIARYFRKIDVVAMDVQRMEKKLDEHCKENNGFLSRVMPYLRDAVTVVTIAMMTILTGVVVGAP